MFSDFYKKDSKDKIWRVDKIGFYGGYYFSFDKKKIYNFWKDYPHKLTPKEKELFDIENPEIAALKDD